jgi:hypothetical protein
MKIAILTSAVLVMAGSLAMAQPSDNFSKQNAPGQRQINPGDAKKYAPGQRQTKPGEAKKFAPGHQEKPPTTTGRR